MFKPPSPQDGGQARGAPRAVSRRIRTCAARFGAPALIALGSALAVLALLFCAMFVPGFVRPAGAETTSSTLTAPAHPSGADPAAPNPAPAVPLIPVPAEPAPGRQLVTLPWGAGDGQVGLARPVEGLTRGPEALAVAPGGRIAILDSVNSRLVLLAADGSFTNTIPLTLSEPRFLAVDDQAVYVLDADADRQLVSLDWQGVALHSAQVPAVDDVVTGLLLTVDGPCIEVAHDNVFVVDFNDTGSSAARSGKPTKAGLRATAGRPVDRDLGKAVKITFKPKDGMKVKRFKVDKKSLKGEQTQAVAPKFAGRAIECLVSVDGDGRGGLIVGARMLRSKGDPKGAPSLVVGRLAAAADQGGTGPALTDTVTLSDSPFAYLGQPYTVAPDGRVLQPVGSDQGYTIFIYTLPGSAASASTPGKEEVQP
jgi:hypothetical protein